MARTPRIRLTIVQEGDGFTVGDNIWAYGHGTTLRKALLDYASSVSDFLLCAQEEDAQVQERGGPHAEQVDAYRATLSKRPAKRKETV